MERSLLSRARGFQAAALLAAFLLAILAPALSGSALAADAAAPASAAHTRDWRLPVELAAGGSPVAGPTGASLRLVRMPRGTTAVEVSGARAPGDAGGVVRPVPASAARVKALMRLRGEPIALLLLDEPALRGALAAAGGPGASLAEGAALEIVLSATASAATGGSSTDAFADPLAIPAPGLIAPGELARLLAAPRNPDGSAPSGQGCYLIVTAPEFAETLAPLVSWKQQAGYTVRLYTTNETGTSADAIAAFVQNAYDTWPEPPLYLLLVGDTDRIPTFTLSGNVTDHPYSLVDGDDFLADLFVGRFSGKLAGEIAVQVAKTVGYESSPDTTGGAAWCSQALMVAGNYASTTPVSINRWFGRELAAIGYTRVDSVYWSSSPSHPWWTGRIPIRAALNRGASVVNYRGWAYGDIGWQPPEFLAADVPSLQNGWKLPVVFSIVCHTGNYGSPFEDCMGEAWLKAGTAAEPKGAVAFFGTAEHWSHSRWNDRMDIGVCEALCHQGLRRFGAIVTGAKLSLIEQFPTELWMTDAYADPEESVEYYNNTYNVLGDPSLLLWTAPPQPLAVTGLPATLPAGANAVSVAVRQARTDFPALGARIAFTQGDRLVGYAVVTGSAATDVQLADLADEPLLLTVTGENLHPYQAVIPVGAEAYALTCTGATVGGGGPLLPGKTLELTLQARNSGTSALTGATATIAADGWVTVIEGGTSFGALAPGAAGSALSPARIALPPQTENGMPFTLRVTPTIQGLARTATEVRLVASAPAYAVAGLGDGGDQVFNPGEEASLIVTLRNDGPVAAGTLTAALAAIDPASIEILDGAAGYPEIAPGASVANSTNPLRVRIPATAVPGTVIPLRLTLAASGGPEAWVSVALPIGQVDASVPSGPDAYGYYAYDSADIDFPGQAPVYDWVECSPLFAGTGERLTAIGDNRSAVVALPFTFQYYGRPYDSIRVSDNGWISFDLEDWYDIRNWNMPGKWGGACQVAPFWDNLDPTQPGSDGIYALHDAARGRFVIEWSRLRNWETEVSSSDTTDYWTDFHTFELILHDPDRYPTESGDGEIVFQYKQVVDNDFTRMYSTVGIEDHTEEIGLTYAYGSRYAEGAAPLSNGLAIKVTTEAPVYAPLAVSVFAARWSAGGSSVEIDWELPAATPLTGLALERASLAPLEPGVAGAAGETAGAFVRMHAEWLGPGCRAWVDADPALDRAAGYAYRLVGVDRFGKLRTLGETRVASAGEGGTVATELGVRLSGGSIAAGAIAFSVSAPASGAEELAIYDAAGRRVADLRAQLAGASSAERTVAWDGRDGSGRRAAAGLYWVRLRAAGQERTERFLLVR